MTHPTITRQVAEIGLALSPAQFRKLQLASEGKAPPMELICLDPPLVRGDGSRTKIGDAVRYATPTAATHDERVAFLRGILGD